MVAVLPAPDDLSACPRSSANVRTVYEQLCEANRVHRVSATRWGVADEGETHGAREDPGDGQGKACDMLERHRERAQPVRCPKSEGTERERWWSRKRSCRQAV